MGTIHRREVFQEMGIYTKVVVIPIITFLNYIIHVGSRIHVHVIPEGKMIISFFVLDQLVTVLTPRLHCVEVGEAAKSIACDEKLCIQVYLVHVCMRNVCMLEE